MSRPIDITAVRAQFPALRRQVGDLPAVFLDGPSGTQVPQSVIDAMTDYLYLGQTIYHTNSFICQKLVYFL